MTSPPLQESLLPSISSDSDNNNQPIQQQAEGEAVGNQGEEETQCQVDTTTSTDVVIHDNDEDNPTHPSSTGDDSESQQTQETISEDEVVGATPTEEGDSADGREEASEFSDANEVQEENQESVKMSTDSQDSSGDKQYREEGQQKFNDQVTEESMQSEQVLSSQETSQNEDQQEGNEDDDEDVGEDEFVDAEEDSCTLDLSVKKKPDNGASTTTFDDGKISDEVPADLTIGDKSKETNGFHDFSEGPSIDDSKILSSLSSSLPPTVVASMIVDDVKLKELTPDQVREKERRIRKLQAKLRAEESKLVILKKIRQTQLAKENLMSQQPPSTHGTHLPPSIAGSSLAQQLQQDMRTAASMNLPHHIGGIPSSFHQQIPGQHPSHLRAHQTSSSQRDKTSHHGIPSLSQPPPPPSHHGSHHRSALDSTLLGPHGMIPRAAHESRSSSGRGSSGVFNPPVPPAHSRGSSSSIHGVVPPPPLGMTSSGKGQYPHQGLPAPAHSGSIHHRSSIHGSRATPVTTPPNVVMGFPVSELHRASAGQARSSPTPTIIDPIAQAQQRERERQQREEERQTPAQRAAAAKAVLRKNLEKTLLQIAPPKPPPPEMHFIPNANNTEFVYYLGLETVVDHLISSPNISKGPPEPFECCQCGTDYTPVWKWQDIPDPKQAARPAVICEVCVTSNVRKALKAEHTGRLKKAFLQALQAEQEIDTKLATGTFSPPPEKLSSRSTRSPNTNGLAGVGNLSILERQVPPSTQPPPARHALSSIESSIRESFAREEAARNLLAAKREMEQQQLHHRGGEHRESSSHHRELREHSRDRRERVDRGEHRGGEHLGRDPVRDATAHHQHASALAAAAAAAANMAVAGLPTPPAAHSSGFAGSAGSTSSATSSTRISSRQRERERQQQEQEQQQAAVAANAAALMAQHTALLQNLPKLTPVQQQAFLLQIQQLAASMPPAAPGLPALAPFLYQFGLLGKGIPGLTPEQLQRQFLLDMISPGAGAGRGNLGSGSGGNGGAGNWKP